jgi:hypothetical protein
MEFFRLFIFHRSRGCKSPAHSRTLLLDLGLNRFAGAIIADGKIHGYRVRETF